MATARTGPTTRALEMIPIRLIGLGENARQGRLPELGKLSVLIAKHGLIHPVTVTHNPGPDADGHEYTLVAGFRRFAAWRLLYDRHLTAHASHVPNPYLEIPALVTQLAVRSRVTLLNLAENMGRTDLSPLDMGDAFQRLINDHDMTIADIMDETGISQSYTYQCLRLSKGAAPELRDLLKKNIVGTIPPKRTLLDWGMLTHTEQKEKIARWLGRDTTKPKRVVTRRTVKTSLISGMLSDARADPETWETVIPVLEYLMGTRRKCPIPIPPRGKRGPKKGTLPKPKWWEVDGLDPVDPHEK